MTPPPIVAAAGISAPALGYGISLTSIEPILRVGSLCVGILVGILSCISLAFSIRRKWRAYQFNKKQGYLANEETTTTAT